MTIGQEQIIQSIFKSIDEDRFAHATLIEGSPGYGTLAVALDIAQYLVCSNRSAEQGPCRSCKSCGKAAKYIHPDIHFAFPSVTLKEKKRKDTTSVDFLKDWRAQLEESQYFDIDQWVGRIVRTSARPDINVAECNTIIKHLNLQSFEGGAKVQIIWMAQYLGNNANRLLKLIEEPPERTYILLINDADGQIINTVRSRCQTIKLPRISDEQIEQGLIALSNVEQSRAREISLLAEGDWITAASHVEMHTGEMIDISLGMLELAYSSDYLQMRTWVEHMDQYDLMSKKAILSYSLRLLKELLHIKYGHTDLIRISDVELVRLQRSPILSAIDVDVISDLSDVISDCQMYLDRNANAKIILYNSCLQIESILSGSVMYSNKL
jgi:DNA polymerase-3 subunit delta'